LEGPEAETVVEKSLRPLLDEGADIIVLGCTHYPFLMPIISKIAGPDVKIIDPAPAVARHLVRVMAEEGLLTEEQAEEAMSRSDIAAELPYERPQNIELYSSGSLEALGNIYNLIYGD